MKKKRLWRMEQGERKILIFLISVVKKASKGLLTIFFEGFLCHSEGERWNRVPFSKFFLVSLRFRLFFALIIHLMVVMQMKLANVVSCPALLSFKGRAGNFNPFLWQIR